MPDPKKIALGIEFLMKYMGLTFEEVWDRHTSVNIKNTCSYEDIKTFFIS